MKEQWYEKHRNYLFPCVANYYKEPLVLERGQGKYITDIDGNQYLDFFGGILTVSIGHCDPVITQKVINQMKTLQHCSTLYQNKPMLDFATKLAEITPGRLQKSFFTNSGTEANETAILLAQMATGREEIIALRHCYSGRSMLAMALTAHSPYRLGVNLGIIKHAHSPYCYRCAFGRNYPNCDLECAKDVEELIKTTTRGEVAAFIAEPIQGVGGFITPPKEYFQEVLSIIRKFGGLFICDEVQTGFGRTGTKMFGIEHWNVEPDIITFAKGTANGLAIGGTIAAPEVADKFVGATISTFGGNPVSMAGALATVEFIEKNNIPGNCQVVGGYLREKLEELQDKYPAIGDVRGMGLMQALEVVKENKEPDPETVLRVFEETKKRGLLIGKGGLYNNTIRISPPMTIDKGDVDEAIKVLDAAFEAACG